MTSLLYPKRRPLIIDGGMGSELERRGYNVSTRLWSAQVLRDYPDAITQVHRDFLAAGADIITTCSFQATIAGFTAAGMTSDEARCVMKESIKLATTERDKFYKETGKFALVAASIGCFGAHLANGSEYSGNYGSATEDDIRSFHLKTIDILSQEDGVDVFLIETVPCILESRALKSTLVAFPNLTFWISFSCLDGKTLRDGSLLADALHEVVNLSNVSGIGVNCHDPKFSVALIDTIRQCVGSVSKEIICYPNSGEKWDVTGKKWIQSVTVAENFLAVCQCCKKAGATVIGGCCRITPEHIRTITTCL